MSETVQAGGDHAKLAAEFGDDVQAYEVLDDGVGVTVVGPDGLFTIARKVRSMGYRILSLLSAYDGGDHFGVLYAFVKPSQNPEEFAELRLRCVMPKQEGETPIEPECPSLVDLFTSANWHEREMYDMYGIRFLGHPDLRRMFLPEGWTGYPMRKDYSEDEQFVAMDEGEDIVLKKESEGAW